MLPCSSVQTHFQKQKNNYLYVVIVFESCLTVRLTICLPIFIGKYTLKAKAISKKMFVHIIIECTQATLCSCHFCCIVSFNIYLLLAFFTYVVCLGFSWHLKGYWNVPVHTFNHMSTVNMSWDIMFRYFFVHTISDPFQIYNALNCVRFSF